MKALVSAEIAEQLRTPAVTISRWKRCFQKDRLLDWLAFNWADRRADSGGVAGQSSGSKRQGSPANLNMGGLRKIVAVMKIGTIGLAAGQALGRGWVTNRPIANARFAMTRFIKPRWQGVDLRVGDKPKWL